MISLMILHHNYNHYVLRVLFIERAQGLRKFVGQLGNVEAIIAEVECYNVKVS